MEKLRVLLNADNHPSYIDRILHGNWEITFENGLPRIRVIDGTIQVEPVCSNVVKVNFRK